MKAFASEFKSGCINAIGAFGAIALTIFGILIVSIAIMAYYSMVLTKYICGIADDRPSPFELTISSVCDTYLYWYENITTAIKNLVK